MADTELTQGAGLYESEAQSEREAAAQKSALVKRWLETIELASKEEEEWRKTSAEARDVYESSKDAPTGTAFNIYYATIETIRPALYNSTPVPDVRRRYNDKDPAAKEGADAIERAISYSIDDYDFDGTIREAIDDLSITGRGITRVALQSQIVDGQVQDVGAQSVTCETVPWASFRRGPARSWEGVPWVAFAHYLTRDQIKALNPEKGALVPLDMVVSEKGEAGRDGADHDNPESDVYKRALVWEIWEKAKRRVIFIATSWKEEILAETEDPLGLRGFFPVPSPMMSGKTSGRLVPLSPYKVQKPLLTEIDTITKRISKLVAQLRPRAVAPDNVDMDEWASADDGAIVGVTNVMSFMESGGMDKLLSWFPMEPTVKAIESLYARREQAKAEYFEISGVADIMRGQSNPNETRGAQEMKQRWGSLRLQKAQAEIQRFVRDLFRMKAEIIAEKFTPENIAAMTGIELSSPAMMMLKNERMRGYRIDVETDSTIRGDLTRNQEAMAQFVQGSAQYFTAIAPIVQAGGMSKTAAVTIYSAFARNFKLGKEVDAVLDSLADEATKAEQAAQAQGPQPNPEMEKVKAEAENNAAKIAAEKEMNAAKANNERLKLEQDAAYKTEMLRLEADHKNRAMTFDAFVKLQQLDSQNALDARRLQSEDMRADKQLMSKEKQGAVQAAQSGQAQAASLKGVAEVTKGLAEVGRELKTLAESMLADRAEDRAERARPKKIKTPSGGVYELG